MNIIKVYLSDDDYKDDNYYDDADNYVILSRLIVLLLHLRLNILIFTLIMASHAVFSLGVVPLNKCTCLPTSRGDFGDNPPP